MSNDYISQLFPDLKDFDPGPVDPSELISDGFILRGKDNPMYGLKGKDHPGGQWKRDENFKKYMSEYITEKQWKNNDERRKLHSELMKNRWKNNYEKMRSNAILNGRHGQKGKEVHNTLELDYKGKMYYGYRELKEATGVSKHLYRKYYLKGIDPEFRIGTNGPIAKK